MTTNTLSPGAILVGYDGRRSSRGALCWAVHEARSRNRALHVLHVQPWAGEPLPGTDPRREERVVMESAMSVVEQHAPGLEMRYETVTGPPARELLTRAQTSEMVVLGGQRQGTVEAVVGGAIATQLAGRSGCPLVVVNDTMRLAESSFPAGERTYRRHLTVGVDGSEACGPAVAFAFDRASRLGLALTAVACWWWQDTGPYLAGAMDWSDTARDSEARLVSEQLAGWCDKYPDVKVESTLVRGHPVETLIEESAGSELLVVGSRGHGGFAGLVLGSVSLRVLTHARTPVAVVPSELSSDE